MSGAESQGRNTCPCLCPSPSPARNESDGSLFRPPVWGACRVSVGSKGELSAFVEAVGEGAEPLRRRESKHVVADEKRGS